jgi:hypothetical protein
MSRSKTFQLGRNTNTGRFETVKKALTHPSTSVIERVPKAGFGDTSN